MTEQYFSMNNLRDRGWTDRLVGLFLGNADRTLPNPHQSTGRPKRLFAVDRVIEIESTPAFQQEKERSVTYSARLKGSSDTKREGLEALVKSLQLPPLEESLEALMLKATQRRVADPRLWRHSESRLALEDLLDTMKSLDWHLDAVAWHPGVKNARKLLRNRMLAHIIDHYPTLAQAAQERAAHEEGNAGTGNQKVAQ